MELGTLMTPDPITVAPGATLDAALRLMDDHDVRHLPVVEATQGLVGVISDRDLLGHVGWVPAMTEAQCKARAAAPGPHTVAEIMHRHPTTAAPQDTVVTGAVDLVVGRFGCLPVLDQGRLVGLVSEMDLLKAFWRLCKAGGLEGDVDPAVERMMTRSPVTVAFKTPVRDAAELCRERHIRHLPVVEGKRLLGVLSDRDLRAACARGGPGDHTAGTIMVPYPVTLEPGERLSDAAEKMVGHRISCLPVVDGNELLGLLTMTDLLDHCLTTLRDPETR